MGTAENKRIARLLLDDLFREESYRFFADGSGFEGHMIDYEISPIRKENEEQRKARSRDLASEMRRSGKALLAVYPDGNTRAIKSITAEGERVVAEYLVHGGRSVFAPDIEHNFHVVKVFEFAQGRVTRMREYCDSAFLGVHGRDIAQYMHETARDGIDEAALRNSAWSSDWCLTSTDIELGSDAGTTDPERVEGNKRVVRELIEASGSDRMADHLDPDVFFTNEVDLTVSPVLGRALRGRDELVAAARRFASAFDGDLRREVVAVTAEANRVVAEELLTGTSRFRPDTPFRVAAAKICLLRDGKVFRIRQHLDSGFCEAYSQELLRFVVDGTEPS
jgi:ketosteroid isomerase-like protein